MDHKANFHTPLLVVTSSAPKMGMYLAVIVAVQIMLAGAYIVYKKRRASAPKKYL